MALWHSKREWFLEPGALNLQKVVSHLVWGHWRFRHIMFSRVGRLGLAENDHLTCSLLVLGKRKPIESTITWDQPSDKLKSARKTQKNISPPLPTAAVWAQPTKINKTS